MTSPSKRKGNTFERELVNKAKERGLDAIRAYASDGRSLGESSEVDVLIQGMRIQAKRRKSIASFLQIPECADAVVFRQDKGETLVLLRFDDLLDKLQSDW